jgi:hypothetical protein
VQVPPGNRFSRKQPEQLSRCRNKLKPSVWRRDRDGGVVAHIHDTDLRVTDCGVKVARDQVGGLCILSKRNRGISTG